MWRKYRGPPGAPAADPSAFDATPEGRALRAWYEGEVKEERLKQRDRVYEEGGEEEDPFYADVWYGPPEGWDLVRRYARLAAAAVTEEHGQAFIEQGWVEAKELVEKEREEREGWVPDKLEHRRRMHQGAADGAQNECNWNVLKVREMKVWLELERQKNRKQE
ncbi:MAG: hypothetical protein LQ340_005461 [Diploschistes diacapsis]|nr:MAG: hypothetical protein LQ340_005461 [Diploschistes diacapsis]